MKKIIKSVRYSSEEWSIIQNKSKNLNMKTGTYIQHISVNGKIVIVNTPEYQNIKKELNRIGVSYNQIARRLNETSSIYYDDIENMKEEFEELCRMLNVYLSTLRQQEL